MTGAQSGQQYTQAYHKGQHYLPCSSTYTPAPVEPIRRLKRKSWVDHSFKALATKRCGAHNIVTSSTRMEVKAVRQALSWLITHEPKAESVILTTDSQALLSRIKSGWLPDGWVPPPSEALVMSRIVWVYVPGHAGVTINEEADRLAAAATDTSP